MNKQTVHSFTRIDQPAPHTPGAPADLPGFRWGVFFFAYRHVALVLLLFQTSTVILTMRYSLASNIGTPYIKSTAVVMSELLKLVCASLHLVPPPTQRELLCTPFHSVFPHYHCLCSACNTREHSLPLRPLPLSSIHNGSSSRYFRVGQAQAALGRPADRLAQHRLTRTVASFVASFTLTCGV